MSLANGSTVQATAPGKVPNLAAAPTGDKGIVLTWDAPADNGGRSIARCRIEWSAGRAAPWTELVAEHVTMQDAEIDRRQPGRSPGASTEVTPAARSAQSNRGKPRSGSKPALGAP